MGRVFANGPGDLNSIPGHVIPKTLKIVLDTSLLNTQHYKVRVKGKVELSRERTSALPYTLVYQLSKREPSGSPRLGSPTLYRFQVFHTNSFIDSQLNCSRYERLTFVYTQWNGQTALFRTIRFNISYFFCTQFKISNSSFWTTERTLFGATTPGQNRSGNDDIEGVLSILQSSEAGSLIWDC